MDGPISDYKDGIIFYTLPSSEKNLKLSMSPRSGKAGLQVVKTNKIVTESYHNFPKQTSVSENKQIDILTRLIQIKDPLYHGHTARNK